MNIKPAYIQQAEFLLRKYIETPAKPLLNSEHRFSIRSLAGDFSANTPERLFEKIEDYIFCKLNAQFISKNYNIYNYVNDDVLSGSIIGSITLVRKKVEYIEKIKRLFKKVRIIDNTVFIDVQGFIYQKSNKNFSVIFNELKKAKRLFNYVKKYAKILYDDDCYFILKDNFYSIQYGERIYTAEKYTALQKNVKRAISIAKKLNEIKQDTYFVDVVNNKFIVNINHKTVLTGTRYRIVKSVESFKKYKYQPLTLFA